MKTIQMTLDDELIKVVDMVVAGLKTTRSAFTRKALREAVKRVKYDRLELMHRKGYLRAPVNDLEFAAWEHEQDWGDE